MAKTTDPKRNEKVLAALREHEDAKGYPPTIGEIVEATGLTQSMVQGALWQMLAQRPAPVERTLHSHRRWWCVRQEASDEQAE